MNKLWKIIKDSGEFEVVDLPKITYDEWVVDDGWARYHGFNNAEPLTYRCASITYFENFFQIDCKDERGSDYERAGCFIKEGDIVVDVGANIGCFSRYALTKNPSRVISYEPFSKNFECLKYNTKDTICEIHQNAVSNNSEPITLLGSDTFSGGSNIMNHDQNGLYNISETVDCVTLDSLFENDVIDKIDFLKIDVEGAEIQVIKGLNSDNLFKVKKIAMEVHKNMFDKSDLRDMVGKIGNAGFNLFTFDLPGDLSIYHWYR
tara:strand:+ start:1018 stop:1803 length:786 start_codon:yes stop_codon:yes gene_type:complete